MKKITSIILLLTIISSCFALASCSLDGIISFITGNEKEVVFEHSDNFTEDDIEFVKRLHGKKIDGYNNDKPHHDLYSVLRIAKGGANLFLIHFERPYVIIAYHKPNYPFCVYDDKTGTSSMDVTYFVWHKFNTTDEIPDTIDDNTKTDYAYLLYDCTIEEDIANVQKYDHKCKFYTIYKNEASLDRISEYMLMYFEGGNIAEKRFRFINANIIVAFENKVYADLQGTKYLYFRHEVYFEDGTLYKNYSRSLFGEYYDELFADFKVIDEVRTEENHIYTYAGVEIEKLSLFINK